MTAPLAAALVEKKKRMSRHPKGKVAKPRDTRIDLLDNIGATSNHGNVKSTALANASRRFFDFGVRQLGDGQGRRRTHDGSRQESCPVNAETEINTKDRTSDSGKTTRHDGMEL